MQFTSALITGATSGIGEALAYLLARQHISLILTGRNHHKLFELQQKLSQHAPVSILAADLSINADRQKIVSLLKEKKPNLVINNAGYGMYGEALEISEQEQLKMIEVDVKAVVELTIEASKSLLAAQHSGIILNVSSAAAYQIFPNFAVYAASKAFILNFSQSIDFELKSKGIRVLVACPGQVKSDFFFRAGGQAKKRPKSVMSASYAAKQIWKQIKKEKLVSIFDWKYWLGTQLSHFLPKRWIAPILQKEIAERSLKKH